MKTKLFRKWKVLTCYHFSSCVLLRKKRSGNVPFPGVSVVEMTDNRIYATNINVFENRFTVEVIDNFRKTETWIDWNAV
jgi:hypothetical protein